MLTRVILDGVMGNRFGREWELEVNSAPEALRMIDANKPGFMQWIRANLPIYDRYRVVCKYEDGKVEALDGDSYVLSRRIAEIRFVPIPVGAGAVGRIIIGIIIIAANWLTGYNNPQLYAMGASMILGGVIEALTPMPKLQKKKDGSGASTASDYFNGPMNTAGQGVPVPIIYGRVLAGSQAVSAALTIDKMM